MSVIVDRDLRLMLGPVRNQGQRPTCLAFATTAAHEALRRNREFLSVEYLYYRAIQRSHKDPKRGVDQIAVATALRQDGQPLESVWRYMETLQDPVAWSPPPVGEPLHRATILFARRSATEVRRMIEAGVPVVLVVTLTMALYAPRRGGVVQASATDSEIPARHAVLGVGSGHSGEGEALVLVRNSWGTTWGEDGHSWLTESYLAKHLHDTAVIA